MSRAFDCAMQPGASNTWAVIVSTFAMPTDDAPFDVGASLVAFGSRARSEWSDTPDGTTYLVITHDDKDTKSIEHLALRAHPEVKLISSTAA